MTTTYQMTCSSHHCVCRRGRVHRRRWLTVLTAMATANAVGGIAGPVLGIDLVVQRGPDSVAQVAGLAITLTSLGVGFAAWGLLALLERRLDDARRVWTGIAVPALAVSLLGPLSAVTPGATAVLVLLHVVVGGILIVGLRRSAPREEDCPAG